MDVDVSALGFGLMGISAFYGQTQSDEERFAVSPTPGDCRLSSHQREVSQVLDAAYEAGCRLWDTADVYKDSEDLIGKW